MTDREIKEALHFEDMNQVRPRLTEMIKAGVVRESGSKLDQSTNMHVRTLEVVANPITQVGSDGQLVML